MFDEIDERGQNVLAEALTTPADGLSSFVTAKHEKVRPMVERTATGRDVGEVLDVGFGKRDGGKGQTVQNRHYANKDGVKVAARSRKIVWRDEGAFVNAPTDNEVNEFVADAQSKCKSIAKDRNNIEQDTER